MKSYLVEAFGYGDNAKMELQYYGQVERTGSWNFHIVKNFFDSEEKAFAFVDHCIQRFFLDAEDRYVNACSKFRRDKVVPLGIVTITIAKGSIVNGGFVPDPVGGYTIPGNNPGPVGEIPQQENGPKLDFSKIRGLIQKASDLETLAAQISFHNHQASRFLFLFNLLIQGDFREIVLRMVDTSDGAEQAGFTWDNLPDNLRTGLLDWLQLACEYHATKSFDLMAKINAGDASGSFGAVSDFKPGEMQPGL